MSQMVKYCNNELSRRDKSLLLTLLGEKVSVRIARQRYAATRPLSVGRLSAHAQMVQVLSPEKMLAYFLAWNVQQTAPNLIQFICSMTGLYFWALRTRATHKNSKSFL